MEIHINRSTLIRLALIASLIVHLATMSTRLHADSGPCGGATTTVPFTDVAGSIFFCSIAEAFFSGLTNGTTSTTYSPSQNVPRDQMAAFITRTLDQSLTRGSRRAALNQWWTPQTPNNVKLTSVGHGLFFIFSDGADLWVSNHDSDSVSRVRASDGSYLGTWTGVTQPGAILAAEGLIFVTGEGGTFFDLDPAQPPGAVVPQCQVGPSPRQIAFDGGRFWTANYTDPVGSVSIVSFAPLSVTTLTTGFSRPLGIIFDGSNIWVSDQGDLKLKKLDSNGNIILSVDGCGGALPAFDGTNIWVPTFSNVMFVVRAKGGLSGTVLAQLTGNGLVDSVQAAFDGARILVTTGSDSLSLWKASDFTPLGSLTLEPLTYPAGVCSDGINFWIALNSGSAIARF